MKWVKELFGKSVASSRSAMGRKLGSQDEALESIFDVMVDENVSRGEAVEKLTGGANLVDGKHTWEHATDGKHDIDLMKRCCEAELATYKITGDLPAPFYFLRVAILSSKQKKHQQEADYLQMFVDILCREYARDDMPLEEAVKKRVLSSTDCEIYDRLPKAKARLAKQKLES